MLKNYLKIAWRNLFKNPLFSFINIFGLSLSIYVCMLVMVQVKDELSYDLFHPHPQRTYRIIADVVENKNNKQYKLASTPLPLISELSGQKDIVEQAVQLYPALKGKASNGDKELYINGAFTDPSFFKVFGFKLFSGDQNTAFEATNGIVLTSETAAKFFGKTDPVGKTLSFDKTGVFQVTGVLEKKPGKSHLDFDAYASSKAITQLEKAKVLPPLLNNWNSMNNAYSYVVLKKGISEKTLNKILQQIASKPELKSGDGKFNFISQSLTKITPGTDGIYNEPGKGTVWAKLLTVIGAGLIILIAAGFNYTNLTIARALSRAKEVGIRKASGASRFQIFFQYIIEAVLIALLALVFAYLLFVGFKPGEEVPLSLVLTFFLFTIITGTIAGAFPAWVLSSFKPVNVLKNISTQKIFGNLSLQKGLMVFQFTLSLIIIIFLSAYYRQFSYLKTLDLGFYSKNIITIPFSGKDKVFVNEVSRLTGVGQVYRVSENFGLRQSGSVPVFQSKTTVNQGILSDYYFIEPSTVTVQRLKLIAGENFFEKKEYIKEKSILINEKAVGAFGFKNAVSAVGKTVWLNDSTPVEVIGVIKDFYHIGAARRITPLVLRNKSDAFNYLNIEVNAADKEQVIKQISTVWNKLNAHTPFTYEWLDKKIANREDQSDAYATMGFLAFITVSIASLGLLGLVVYTVETRQKEISIRKVIGASISELMLLLSKGFLKLLLISGLIAMPIGYIISFFFLQNFANRVPFGLGTLLLSFLFLLLIGLFTILSQTYKASSENPVKNLRNE